MGSHDSSMGGLDNMPAPGYDHSTSYILSQPKTSDTKRHLEGNTLQTLTQGLGKGAAAIELTIRPKDSGPDPELPAYGQAVKSSQSLAIRTRQSARSTKFFGGVSKPSEGRRPKTSKPSEKCRAKPSKLPIGEVDDLTYIDLPRVTVIPATMFTLESAPTRKSAFYFSGVVKGYSTLDRHCVNGEQPAFLELPIASGDWSGVRIFIFTRQGRVKKMIRLFGRVTWGRVLKRLHQYHPTGTCYNVDPEEDDDPDNYREFFKVGFSLEYGDL